MIETDIIFKNIFKDLKLDGIKFQCNYLIGADGANSTVRKMTTSLSYKTPVYAFEGIVDKNEFNKDNFDDVLR